MSTIASWSLIAALCLFFVVIMAAFCAASKADERYEEALRKRDTEERLRRTEETLDSITALQREIREREG